MTRKAIQIAATFNLDEVIVYALCDDGTIYEYDSDELGSWYELAPIPGTAMFEQAEAAAGESKVQDARPA